VNRRTFLKATGAAALAASLPGCQRVPPVRWNLLFVLADQWRFAALDPVSGSPIHAPNIDRLAEQGLRCSRAYAANPVCAPSRASIMTGRLPHQHGVIENQLTLPPSERGFARSFADAGFDTHYIGKWHLDGAARPGFVPPGWRRHGFETFEGFNRGHRYERPRTFTNEGELLTPEVFEATYQTDRAIHFMETHRADPFFCFLSWGPPHPASFGARASMRFASTEPPWRANVPARFRERRALRSVLGSYYDLCERLDDEMGRLLAALEGAGLAERTLVVFTSDHGDMLGSHGLLHKEHPYEESVRVPLILRMPGRIRPSSESEALVSGIDLMPTLTRLCGLGAPETCTGRDLSAVLLGEGAATPASSIYCQGRMGEAKPVGRHLGQGAWRAVVTERHKLVVDETGKALLAFDLAQDPQELENLAEGAAHVALIEDLEQQLEAWKSRTNDPFPGPVAAAQRAYDDRT
jgi:arylsulfatase A-like enzyme